MPRQLKPYKIKELNLYKLGVKTIIYLDRNKDPAVFYANVNGLRVEGSSEAECIVHIKEEAHKTSSLKWEQIIKIHLRMDPVSGSTSVAIVPSRHEIAEKPDGTYVQREFRMPPGDPDYNEDREESSFTQRRRELCEDVSVYYGPTTTTEETASTTYVIPYTIESWYAVKIIEQAIRTLRERILFAVSNEEALRRIYSGATKLLGDA